MPTTPSPLNLGQTRQISRRRALCGRCRTRARTACWATTCACSRPTDRKLQAVSGGRLVQLTGVEEISAEAGRTAYGLFLLEPPGLTSATISWISPSPVQTDATTGLYRLTVQKEAGRPAEPLSVTVTVPEGATILGTSAGMAVNGRTATLQTTAATDVQLWVRYSLPKQDISASPEAAGRASRGTCAGGVVAPVPRVYHRSAIARGSTLHMDLRRQLTILRAWLWLLVASVLLAASAAFLVSGTMPKIYQAQNTLLVGQSADVHKPKLRRAYGLATALSDVCGGRHYATLAQLVIARLGLQMTADQLLSEVGADVPTDKALIYIIVSDTDPVRAANIANALADELIAESPAVQGQQADLQKAIQANLDSTQAEITQTQDQIDQLTALTVRTADQDQELQTLETRLVSLRATYAALVPSLNTNSSGLLTIVGAGRAPHRPSSPRTLLNMLLAAVLGLLAAVGIASWPSIWTIRSRRRTRSRRSPGCQPWASCRS